MDAQHEVIHGVEIADARLEQSALGPEGVICFLLLFRVN